MPYDAEAVRKAYNESAAIEDEFEKRFSLRNEIPRALIKKYLRPSDTVLDAGGGTGVNAIMMAQICQRVTLVDVSPRVLDYAKTNVEEAGLGNRIDLIQGDILDLSKLVDRVFTFVVCLGGTLSYLREKAPDALRELKRVTDDGAVTIIGCDSKYGFVRWLLSETGSESPLDAAEETYRNGEYEAAEGVTARLYTVTELTRLVETAGYEVLTMASTPILFPSWHQDTYPEKDREELMQLEMEMCTKPELLGMGHHLICVARKP
jgi:ubiquinone/menaquinone biosynthesis C-methylase UbiE